MRIIKEEKEKCFQTSFENVNWRRRFNVRWKTVNETRTSDRKRPITILCPVWRTIKLVMTPNNVSLIGYFCSPFTEQCLPQYLSSLLQLSTLHHKIDLLHLIFSPNLKSNINLASRGFCNAVLSLWNSLPPHLFSTSLLSTSLALVMYRYAFESTLFISVLKWNCIVLYCQPLATSSHPNAFCQYYYYYYYYYYNTIEKHEIVVGNKRELYIPIAMEYSKEFREQERTQHTDCDGV